MTGHEAFWSGCGWWWIFPLAMILLCFLMMRRRMGCMTRLPPSRNTTQAPSISFSDSAVDILDKRYALGEISKEEYQEKKTTIARSIR